MPRFAVLKHKITIIFNEKLVEIHKGNLITITYNALSKVDNAWIKIQEIPNWVQKPYFTKFHQNINNKRQ